MIVDPKQQTDPAPIAGEVFLGALAAHGSDFFFANPGTDFPPIIEAFARGARTRAALPRPILVPHENLAVAMAHGAYLMTGRIQTVMVHVNVGTANAMSNLANLSRDRVPLLLVAGRAPITEAGRFGSRDRSIHWAQEMFDQGGMVRELVKWDYELRAAEQTGTVVARAIEVAMTSPRGPVYLVLPREPLSEALLPPAVAPAPQPVPAAPHPDPAAIALLARWIAAAERPLIITAAAGADAAAVGPLEQLAERWAIPVVTCSPRALCLPSTHAMHFGQEPGSLLADADLVIVIESDVPWIPALQGPRAGCRVAHVGEDPSYLRYPMRSFPGDLSITASAATALRALDLALDPQRAAAELRIAGRRPQLARRNMERRARIAKAAQPGSAAISPAQLSRAIGEVMGRDAILFNEYPLDLDHCEREVPGSYFGLSPAGGLGWALGAALGAKLAAPDRMVVATLGDGAYVFSNPTACHWVARAHDLAVLTVIFNNGRYGAVRRATLSMFKDGAASQDDGRLLADFDPPLAFDAIARAHGCHAERVERPADLVAALARARDAVVHERRQALVDVVCPY